ncbi:integrase, catalytic region, zinc finger, CCHC-type containing protein [Tanacetum coccineum]
MSNNNLQTNTSSALHNAIMEVGGKDRPPMLAPGNYNEPYKYQMIANPDTPARPGIDGAPPIRPSRVVETYETEFRKFTSRDGETLDSYYLRFYKMMNNLVRNKCEVTNHQVNVQFLLQLKPEWQRNKGKEIVNTPSPTYDSELEIVSDEEATPRDKEIKKLMALISMSFKKIYKPTNNNLRTSSNTRNKNVDNTPRSNRRIGYDRLTGQYENQRAVNVIGARDNVRTQVVQQTRIQCFNCKEFGQVARECKKAKRLRDLAYHKEKMLLSCYMYMEKIQEVIQDDADNYGPIFDTKPLERYITIMITIMCLPMRDNIEQPESINDTYVMEKDDRKITPDSSDVSGNGREADQDDVQVEERFYNDNLALMLAPETDVTIRLAHENQSKLSDLIKPFDYKNLNNLYETIVPQREKLAEPKNFQTIQE